MSDLGRLLEKIGNGGDGRSADVDNAARIRLIVDERRKCAKNIMSR